MEQTQIYEFLGVDRDPLFYKISNLQVGQAVELGDIRVLLNKQGLYELETEDSHECFRTLSQLYDGISKIYSLIFD